MELLIVIACQSQANKHARSYLTFLGREGYKGKATDLENVFKDIWLHICNYHNLSFMILYIFWGGLDRCIFAPCNLKWV